MQEEDKEHTRDALSESTAVIHMRRHWDKLNSFTSVHNNSTDFGSAMDSFVTNQSSLSARDRHKSILEADLIAAKGTISNLQSKLESTSTSNKRARVEYENDLDLVRKECEREILKVTELKYEAAVATEKERNTRKELTELELKLEASIANTRLREARLQSEKTVLQTELQELRQESQRQVTELRTENRSLVQSVESLKSTLSTVAEDLSTSKQKLVDFDRLTLELEATRVQLSESKQRVHELELLISRADEDATVVKAMKTQLTLLGRLEKENKKLTADNQYLTAIQENTNLLREQCASWHSKCARLEERCSALSSLEVTHEDLVRRLKEWESFDETGTRGLKTAADLKQHLADLQRGSLLQLEKNGQLQTSFNALIEELRVMSSKHESLVAEAADERVKLQEKSNLVKRLQRKLLLVSKERDANRGVINSYESETTMSVDARSKARLRQMEETVKNYRAHISSLEAELERGATQQRQQQSQLERTQDVSYIVTSTSVQLSNQADQLIIVDLRNKIDSLEQRVAKVLDEKEELSAQLERLDTQGEYDRNKVKVLQFTMNPYAMAKKKQSSEIQRLQDENAKLVSRLKLLEEANNQTIADLTERAEAMSTASYNKEIQDLKDQLLSRERKLQRVMEEFKKTSQEIRDVTFQLLGYRIEISEVKLYKLWNIYAESSDDCFLFKKGTGGGMQMLGNDYSSSFVDKIEEYLTTGDSIPAFLSSVTIDLFNRQTILTQ